MPYLLNTWFSRAGHPAARLYDLQIECCSPDNAAIPSDTIVMAENGDGKSSMIQLMISVFIPNKRMITGGKGFDDIRALDSYFKPGEVAWVVLELTVDDDQEVLFNDRPSRIVGYMAYKSPVRDDAGNFELKRHFFSFKTCSGLSIDDVPMGKDITYPEACEWAGSILRQHPRSEVFSHKRQSMWAEFLKRINIHPELMKMQLLMNKKESNADEILKLANINEFVDLVLTPLIDSEKTSSLPDTMEAHRNELANIPDLRKELEFLEQLSTQVSKLQEPGINVELLENKIDLANDHRGRIADKISSTVLHLEKKAEQIRSDVSDAENKVNINENDIKSLRHVVSWVNLRKFQILEEDSSADKMSAEKSLKEAEYNLRLMRAAFCLAKLKEIEGEIRSIDMAIATADMPAQEALQELHSLGAALCRICVRDMKKLDGELSGIKDTLKTHRSEKNKLVAHEARLNSDMEHNRQSIIEIEGWLAEAQSEFNSLVKKGMVLTGESLVEAKERCGSEKDNIQKSIDNKVILIEKIEEETAALTTDHRGNELKKDQCKKEIENNEDAVLRYNKSFERIRDNIIIGELEGVDHVNPYDPGLAGRLEEHIDELTVEQRVLITGMESDRSDLDTLKQNSVLPGSKDVVRVLDYFSHEDIACFGFGQYFAQTRIITPEKTRSLLSQQPAKYSGIVFQSVEDFQKAKKIPVLPNLRGPVELTLQVGGVGTDDDFVTSDTSHVILPDTDASFSGEAARSHKQVLKLRITDSESRLKSLKNRVEDAREVLYHLKEHLEHYTALSFETINSDLQDLKKDLTRLRSMLLEAKTQIYDNNERKKNIGNEIHHLREGLDVQKEQLQKICIQEEKYHCKIDLKQKTIDEKNRHNRDMKKDRLEKLENMKSLDKVIEDLDKKKEGQASLLDAALRDKEAIQFYDEEAGSGTNFDHINYHELNERYKRTKEKYESRSDITKGWRGQRTVLEKERTVKEREYSRLKGDLPNEEVKAFCGSGRLGNNAVPEQESLVGTLRHQAGIKEQMFRQAGNDLFDFQSKFPTIEEPSNARLVSTANEAESVLAGLKDELFESSRIFEKNKEIFGRLEQDSIRCSGDIKTIQAVSKLSFRHAAGCENPDLYFSDPEKASLAWTEVEQTIAVLDTQLNESKEVISRITIRVESIINDESWHNIAEKIKARIRSIKDRLYLDAEQHLSHITQRVDSINETISKMDHRIGTIVDIYQQYVNEALSNLKSLESSSRFPENDGTWRIWSKEPFFKVNIGPNVKKPDYVRARLSSFIERILRNPTVKLGSNSVALILKGLHEVIDGNFSIRALKVQSNPTSQRDDIMQTLAHSGGEKATAAIYLYTTLARMVGNNYYGHKDFPSFLILDNPFGQCNKSSFLKLQREMAEMSNVQLVYFTGIKDTRSLSEFQRFVTLKKRQRTTGGDQRVQAVETDFESITADFTAGSMLSVNLENKI